MNDRLELPDSFVIRRASTTPALAGRRLTKSDAPLMQALRPACLMLPRGGCKKKLVTYDNYSANLRLHERRVGPSSIPCPPVRVWYSPTITEAIRSPKRSFIAAGRRFVN